MILYTISQLGGFYAFWIVTLGALLRTVIEKCFQHEAVNSIHLANKMEFNRLKAELSDQLSQGSNLGREGLSQGLPPPKQIGTRSEVLSKDKQKLIYREDAKQADNNYKKGLTMKQGDHQSISK